MSGRMTSGAHLGLDLGTSSVKAVLISDGDQIASEGATYPVHHAHPGWAESAPQDWWVATGEAVRSVMARAPQVRPLSIGLSGQMHGVVPTRTDGTPASLAILWADSRAEQELKLYRELDLSHRRRLANPLSPGMAGPILGWLAAHQPEVISVMRWALQPKDWLRLQLTGEVFTEPSDASATLLYDLLADAWDAAIAVMLGIEDAALAPLLPSSGTPAGVLNGAAAAFLGLPAGLPVAAGAGDTAAAALGSGLVAPGTAQLTIGTGIQIVTPAEHPVASAEPLTHFYRSATDAGHYRMAAALNGGLALGWVCTTLNASWDELYASARLPPSPGDPIFVPHLNGERTPYMDPTMRGAWTGLASGHTRADLLRSALEGVAHTTAEALSSLFSDETRVAHLRLAGGGTSDPAWRQMLANVLEIELRAVSVTGASGRGAALLGARAGGVMDEGQVLEVAAPRVTSIVQPDASLRDAYAQRHQQYIRTVNRLHARTAPDR